MRVICCGDRNWKDEEKIRVELVALQKAYKNLTVIEGEARGADLLSRKIAEELGIPVEPHPADWQRYGRAAGPIRNQEQLDSGADLVLAFSLRSCQQPGHFGHGEARPPRRGTGERNYLMALFNTYHDYKGAD